MTRVENDEDGAYTHFEGTLANAREGVKARVPKTLWPVTLVVEVEVRADKEGVLGALNKTPEFTETGRKWGVTSRGALKEEFE